MKQKTATKTKMNLFINKNTPKKKYNSKL